MFDVGHEVHFSLLLPRRGLLPHQRRAVAHGVPFGRDGCGARVDQRGQVEEAEVLLLVFAGAFIAPVLWVRGIGRALCGRSGLDWREFTSSQQPQDFEAETGDVLLQFLSEIGNDDISGH